MRLENPEIRSSASRFPSFAGYSDGKQSTSAVSFVGKGGITRCTNLFAPILHTLFTFSLTLLSVYEE